MRSYMELFICKGIGIFCPKSAPWGGSKYSKSAKNSIWPPSCPRLLKIAWWCHHLICIWNFVRFSGRWWRGGDHKNMEKSTKIKASCEYLCEFEDNPSISMSSKNFLTKFFFVGPPTHSLKSLKNDTKYKQMRCDTMLINILIYGVVNLNRTL